MIKQAAAFLTALTRISPVSTKDYYTASRQQMKAAVMKAEDANIAAFRAYANGTLSPENTARTYKKYGTDVLNAYTKYFIRGAKYGSRTKTGRALVTYAKRLRGTVKAGKYSSTLSTASKVEVLSRVFLAGLNHKKITGKMLKATNAAGTMSFDRRKTINYADKVQKIYRQSGHRKEAVKFARWAANTYSDANAAAKTANNKFRNEITKGLKGKVTVTYSDTQRIIKIR